MSSAIVRSNFRKFSACTEALSPKMPPDIFVSPSTIMAIFLAKVQLDVLNGVFGVFHNVVEQRGANRGGAQSDFLADNFCHCNRVKDVGARRSGAVCHCARLSQKDRRVL